MAVVSYVRWGQNDSDVYVFFHVAMNDRGPFLNCCGCGIQDTADFWTTQEMVDHLNEHVKIGDVVPSYVIPVLRAEDKANFPNGN